MTTIEKLYYNTHNLIDDYKDTEETEAKRRAVENALGQKNYTKYEDEIADLECSMEKQGFILGFQYAVSLLTSGKEAVYERAQEIHRVRERCGL